MPSLADEFRDYMQSPAGQEAGRAFVEKFKAEAQARRDYFESADFKRLVDIFEQNAQGLADAPAFDDGDLKRVTECLFELRGDEAVAVEGEEFPTARIRYHGLDFMVTCGQGSFYHFAKAPDGP